MDCARSLHQKSAWTVRCPVIERRIVDFVAFAQKVKMPVSFFIKAAKALAAQQNLLKSDLKLHK